MVFAGTINGNGAIEVESTKPADSTTLAHIIRLVSDAQSRRAPAEQWVERFARIYTPAVFVLAILVMTVPPLLVAGSWTEWTYRGLVLLVIGCPCALVISTPVAVVAALASAAKNGVLIKGGLFIEAPARLRAIAFDKTGTLTIGRPAVTQIVALNGHTHPIYCNALCRWKPTATIRSRKPLSPTEQRWACCRALLRISRRCRAGAPRRF